MKKKGLSRTKRNKLKSKDKRNFWSSMFLICLIVAVTIMITNNDDNNIEDNDEVTEIIADIKEDIVISVAGDCIFGTDESFSKGLDFISEAAKYDNDLSHFMKNVRNIFEKDDYTIVNLEAPFTDSNNKSYKGEGRVFHFKSPKEFVKILTSSSIEGVTISNNHIYDYGQQGYEDTINVLKDNNVQFCGEGNRIITEIKGVKFAFLGYQVWADNEEIRKMIQNDIEELRSNGVKVIIPYFHWGIEKQYNPYDVQVNIAKFSIDCGADLVLGTHPHVMQTIEAYNGKLIIYSFGNFSFGGNFNPTDKRTFILQCKFNFKNSEYVSTEFKVIPTMISSVMNRNDYVPTPAEGENKEEILNFLNEISPTLENKISDEYFSL